MGLDPDQPVLVVQTQMGGGLPKPVANTTLFPLFAQVVKPWYNSIKNIWLLIIGPSGYDNEASDIHQVA